MRAFDERRVLSLIQKVGAMAKAEFILRKWLFTKTNFVIMRTPEADGLLVRGERAQPSVPLKFAKDGAFVFGMKVGRRGLILSLLIFWGK